MILIIAFAILSALCFYGLMWEDKQRWGNPFLMAMYLINGVWMGIAAVIKTFELNGIGPMELILALKVLLDWGASIIGCKC